MLPTILHISCHMWSSSTPTSHLQFCRDKHGRRAGRDSSGRSAAAQPCILVVQGETDRSLACIQVVSSTFCMLAQPPHTSSKACDRLERSTESVRGQITPDSVYQQPIRSRIQMIAEPLQWVWLYYYVLTSCYGACTTASFGCCIFNQKQWCLQLFPSPAV